jgi:outer membrane protein with beta-barrel domain
MMKKLSSGLAALALVFGASALPAQSSKTASVGIAAGAALPFGDYADTNNSGYNGTVFLGVTPYGSPIGIRLDGMYNKFSGKEGFPDDRIIAGSANVVFNLPGVGIRPYLIGGVGYYNLKQDDEFAPTDDLNKVGFNGGAGAAFPLSGFSAFLEARLHYVPLDDPSVSPTFVPVTFGIVF